MKFSVHATEFAQALKAVQSVVDARPLMSIYGCVKVEANEDGLTVIGGTSEQQLSVAVTAIVDEHGAVALPLKELYGYVSVLTEEISVVSDRKGGITLKSGKMKSSVAGQDVDDFSVLSVEADPVFTAKSIPFADGISSVVFAAANELNGAKRILASVHVEVSVGGAGTMVSMSDARLAKYSFSANMIGTEDIAVNIPSSVIKPLCSALRGSDEFSMAIDNYVVCVTAGDNKFIFPQVVGNYVDWRLIFNRMNHDKFARADVTALSNAIRFSGVSAKSGETYLTTLAFDGSKQSLGISSRGVISNANADIGIDYNGEDIKMSFDVRVLQDVINFCSATGAEDIEFGMTNAGLPATIRPIGDNIADCMTMASPVRTLPTA